MLRKIVALVLLVPCSVFGASTGGNIPVPMPLFPANNWWNLDITNAPTDLNSSSFVSYMGGSTSAGRMHPDFGGDAGDGTIYGFPYIIVNGTQPVKSVN